MDVCDVNVMKLTGQMKRPTDKIVVFKRPACLCLYDIFVQLLCAFVFATLYKFK